MTRGGNKKLMTFEDIKNGESSILYVLKINDENGFLSYGFIETKFPKFINLGNRGYFVSSYGANNQHRVYTPYIDTNKLNTTFTVDIKDSYHVTLLITPNKKCIVEEIKRLKRANKYYLELITDKTLYKKAVNKAMESHRQFLKAIRGEKWYF